MTSPLYNVAQLHQAMQYTGSNSADLDAAASTVFDFSIVSEGGGVLTFTNNGNNYNMNTGEWLVYNTSGFAVLPNSIYTSEWDCVALCAELNALGTSTSGVFVRSMGVAPVPTLLLGGTATVAVQLQPAMPDATYSAYAAKFAGVSLTDLQINSVTVIDADTVDVAVENVGVGTITGASVMVHAID